MNLDSDQKNFTTAGKNNKRARTRQPGNQPGVDFVDD